MAASRGSRPAPSSWLGRLRGSAYAAGTIGAIGVLVMVLAALAFGRSSLHSAEQARVNDRSGLIKRLGDLTTAIFDPAVFKAAVDRAPFSEHDPATAAQLLTRFRTDPLGDKLSVAALVRVDGTVLASSPPGASPPTTQLGAAWTNALSGRGGQSTVLRYEGKIGWATLTPVGNGRPWAVLIVFQPSDGSAPQNFAAQLGSISGSGGGVAELDRDGQAMIAWDPRLVGTRLMDPAVIARQPLERVVVTRTGSGDQQVITISSHSRNGQTALFQQRTSALFGDLETRQRERDLTLVAVLIATTASMVVASTLRVRVVRRSRARLHTLLSNTGDLIVVVGPDATLTLVSPTVQTLLGFAAEDWLHGSLLDFAHPEDAAELAQLVADPVGARPLLDVRLRHHDGGYLWFDVEAGDLSNDPELRGVLLTCHNVGERKALKDQLIELGRHDPLTGLPNRLMLNRRLAETLATPATAAGAGLLFIDLDRFKHVNDTYGHECGDQVLRTVADRLGSLVRQHDLVCRFGGDEFGIVLQGSSEAAARRIAERIVGALAEPITPLATPSIQDGGDLAGAASGPLSIRIGASVGIAMAGPELDHPEALLRAADGAMYRAKELGRGRAVIWHEVIGTQLPAGSALAVAPAMAGGNPPTPGAPAGVLPSEPEATADTEALTPSVDDRAALAPQPLNTTDLHLLRPSADPRTATRLGSWRQQIWSRAPLAVACLAIIGVAGVGAGQTSQAYHEAARERMIERLAMTSRAAEYNSLLTDLRQMIKPVSAAPWTLDGSVADSLAIGGVLNSNAGGGGRGQGSLRTPSGVLLTSSGPSALPTVTTNTPYWQAALHKTVGYQPLTVVDGQVISTYWIPIIRHDRVAAVLVISTELRSTARELSLQVVGSVGAGPGGLSSVEPDGRVDYSWNPDLIGRQIITADQIRDLPTGRPVELKGPAGYVTLAARITTPVHGQDGAVVYQQRTSVFYGDLRSGDRSRDAALLIVVALSIGLVSWTRHAQEVQVRRSEQRLTALLRNAHDIVVVVADGNITFVSSAVIRLLGHDPARWLNQPLDGLVHRDDRERLGAYIGSDPVCGRPPPLEAAGTLQDIRLLAADGSYRWFDLHGSDLRDHPEVTGVVFTCHEVGERKALQDELSFRARHDALTGLANRAVFLQHLERLNRDGDDAGGWYTVLFIDLDRFKPVNDTFGHDAGDDVLRSVAHRLSRSCSDSTGSLVCRLGGDEFAVLLPSADGSTAVRLAEDILHRVRQPIPVRGAVGQAVQIGATIGIAHARFADTPSAVVRRADEAMYEAKHAGRGRYAVSVD